MLGDHVPPGGKWLRDREDRSKILRKVAADGQSNLYCQDWLHLSVGMRAVYCVCVYTASATSVYVGPGGTHKT